ncbi:MAG: 30S ribosomal protein S6 [Mariprofundaceae bacterium]|nr:30S ribosomal protein S6 [Mariprofundaceae bacterium]
MQGIIKTYLALDAQISGAYLKVHREGAVYYETIFIVNPDVSQENTEELTDALVERVEKAAGRIVKREYWGSRPLAYSIAKRKRGHYVLLVTDGEPTAIQALESAIRLEERVIRFLTTRLTELSDAPSPLMRRKSAPAEEAPATDDAAAETKTEEPAESKTEEPAETKAEEKAEEPAETKAEVKAEEPVETKAEVKAEEKTKAAASSEETSA